MKKAGAPTSPYFLGSPASGGYRDLSVNSQSKFHSRKGAEFSMGNSGNKYGKEEQEEQKTVKSRKKSMTKKPEEGISQTKFH